MTASFAAKPSRTVAHVVGALALVALTAGCATKFEKRAPDFQARAHFFATGEKQPSSKRLTGKVDLTQNKGVVTVAGQVVGLAPNATMGFHIHEGSRCMNGDASDAGPHFNPGNVAHGAFGKAPHHAGDLPQLKSDAQGVANIEFTTTTEVFSLDRALPNSVIDRVFVVHANADDLTTQPEGNSGPRIACATIRLL